MTNTKWQIDAMHTEIQFKIKHLMISTVTGNFNKFSGYIETVDEDFSTAKVFISADIDSINTNNEQRDAHLRNADFFDVDNHPKLIFESTKMEKVDEENYKLHGILELKGVKKEVIFNVEAGGITQDPWGGTRTGFSVTGKIYRKDFGISFGLLSDTGGVGLGDEVKLEANAQFVKEQSSVAAGA